MATGASPTSGCRVFIPRSWDLGDIHALFYLEHSHVFLGIAQQHVLTIVTGTVNVAYRFTISVVLFFPSPESTGGLLF